ncbi:MAG: NmrA/HSCARG family protein [Nitrospirae bacterium]|nr:NmrA/HSCARG family protein [Nitrospirota bacterium]MDE3043076.1 NmrA/HSCARG family protein [Nitrospirota bacterium]MDE3221119.1 NmrA/HSCARG family protein [Nitrospirota bacterium]
MATQSKLILVTGATGQQGGAVATALLAKGQKVRVMSRTPEKASALAKAGAEVVKGNLTNPSDLQAALRGVQGVFAMSTPFEAGMEAEVRQGIMLADAAKQAGITHYVYTSVGSAHRNTGIPHFESKWKVEQHIRQIGLPATILRPVWFMENFTTFAKPSAQGVLMLPMKPARKLAMVALKDIGAFGAAAFLRPNDFLGQAIDLAGDDLTMSEAAALLTKAMADRSAFRSSRWSRPRRRWAMTSPRCFAGSTRLATRSIFPR